MRQIIRNLVKFSLTFANSNILIDYLISLNKKFLFNTENLIFDDANLWIVEIVYAHLWKLVSKNTLNL